MTLPVTSRPLAALVLAAGLFLALPGCGGETPPPGGDKKDKKGDPTPTPNPTPNPTPGTDPKKGGSDTSVVLPRTPSKVDMDSEVGKEVMAFLKAVRDGTVSADRLSAGFVKAVGLPLVSEADKAKGYSADAAAVWLKQFGNWTGFGLPLSTSQFGETAVFRGALAEGKSGMYSLRLVREGGAWKVDFLSASSVVAQRADVDANDADAVAREFAATAFVELLADRDGMSPDNRPLVIAAAMTPALRAKWADPFASDKTQGYDYNRGALTLKAGEIGGGAEAVATAAQPGQPTVRAEFTKGGAKKAYLLTLTRGPAPGQWLVDAVTPQ